MSGISKDVLVGIVGAGTMGMGIAQVAAAAGHGVRLYDAADGGAERGLQRLSEDLAALVGKGKLGEEAAGNLLARIVPVSDLADLAPSKFVVEAVVEQLDIKQKLFAALEAIVGNRAVLATNTSSISITAIGSALKHPERFVGMHFFNPAPVMKLIEIVSGLATDSETADIVHATATDWGKVAVHTKSTPGFIVNRVARAFYGEPMRLLEEGVASAETLDTLLKHGGGFRMGPFELMDLIGNDVNLAVSRSIFEAFFHEPRFRPSLMQQELVSSGRLGRKSGTGWYDYSVSKRPAEPEMVPGAAAWPDISLETDCVRDGLLVTRTDGRTAAERQTAASGQPVIVHDLYNGRPGRGHLGFAASPSVSAAHKQVFADAIRVRGIRPVELPDWPGLVVLRTLALIANEGFEAVLQGVSDEAGIDAAMVYGVNYPKGPIAWAREVGVDHIEATLVNLQRLTGDTRYRPSLRLRLEASLLPGGNAASH